MIPENNKVKMKSLNGNNQFLLNKVGFIPSKQLALKAGVNHDPEYDIYVVFYHAKDFSNNEINNMYTYGEYCFPHRIVHKSNLELVFDDPRHKIRHELLKIS